MKKALFGVFIILLVLFSVAFLARNYIADKVIRRLTNKLESEYGIKLIVTDKFFTGFKTFEIPHLALLPQNGDTLLSVDSLELNPSFMALLRFHFRLSEAKLTNATLNLSCTDSSCNYSSLRKNNKTPENSIPEKNYAKLAYSLYSQTFNYIPGEAEIEQFNIIYSNDTVSEKVIASNCKISGQDAEGSLSNSTGSRWQFKMSLDQDRRQASLKIYPETTPKEFPFLSNILHLSFAFDTLEFSTGNNTFADNRFTIGCQFKSSSLSLFQPRLSDDTIRVENISSDFTIQIKQDEIEIDSSSVVELNSIPIHPFIKFKRGDYKDYLLSIQSEPVTANEFFRSLPPGMFNTIDGIEAEGKLSYSLSFHLNSEEPDSLEFNSEMKKDKFHLQKFGDNSLLKMNTEFSYTAYEYDKPFRTFMVGPSNPYFAYLEEVSPYLENAILTSEDGSFLFHNGFNEEAFKKSIATNYKEGKFKRGGSTISMQLIKNVYLSRHKTIARKAEEALLVWLIESNHLVSKERMLEVYLNIVELGPGVYGVGEASDFYFNKKPSQLTLSESIFIASLLPHPKWFKYCFDEQGNLKPYFADYYRVVSNFMLRKNLISQEEYDAIKPNVKLTGIAKASVIPSDSIPQEEDEKGF